VAIDRGDRDDPIGCKRRQRWVDDCLGEFRRVFSALYGLDTSPENPPEHRDATIVIAQMFLAVLLDRALTDLRIVVARYPLTLFIGPLVRLTIADPAEPHPPLQRFLVPHMGDPEAPRLRLIRRHRHHPPESPHPL